jgi:hypothetical protein
MIRLRRYVRGEERHEQDQCRRPHRAEVYTVGAMNGCRLAAPLVLVCGLASLFAQQTPKPPSSVGCRVENATFEGWKSVRLANGWVTLEIVPQLGGRLMQVTFGRHAYLFVNLQLKGQYFPPEVSAAQKRWFNYGGDKIWPMPEGSPDGSRDEQHWPGAVGSVLDAGAFSSELLSQGTRCSVRLTGPPDPIIGQQYIRDIGIDADSPAITFHAVMKNVSGYPQTWSEQSVSQYTTAATNNPSEPNADFWAMTPANPKSVFQNSYHVRTGSASSSGYTIRDGLFMVHTIDARGEVWVDSPGEWLAVIDGASEYAIVERFRYEKTAEYPGEATVIFFTAGQPTLYMEAEINSPMVKLNPGESYAMDTRWFPTRTGRELKAVTYAGVMRRALSATSTSTGLALEGHFGVFFAGELEVRFYDARGYRLGAAPVQAVSPLDVVTVKQVVRAPADTTRVSLHLIDRGGTDRGPLGEVNVTMSPGSARP